MLQQLLTPQDAVAWLRARVTGTLRTDSRQVRPGDGFLAWPGAAVDARAHVAAALAAGAAACLVELDGVQAFAFHDARIATYPGLKAASGEVADAWFDQPSQRLAVLAVTGTNGKTSSSWWLAQALSNLAPPDAVPCGVVGTLGVGVPPHLVSTGLTTPDPVALQVAFAEFAKQGLRACAIEASSIGIEEQRLAGTRIHTALLTNVTQDHLDYHGDMARYWQAKARLFAWPQLRAAVINVDDPYGAELAEQLSASALDLWTLSITPGAAHRARLQAQDIRYELQGVAFTVVEGVQQLPLATQLIGDYNVSNVLGVIAAMRTLGVSLADAVQACAHLTPVPGRMECVSAAGQPLVAVDYAHTPDALAKALDALRPLVQARGGQLWCVFGCGGNRDSAKRPLMGAVAGAHADRVVVTSDNPRAEAMDAIISQILLGLTGVADVQVEPDRARAIAQTLAQAGAADVVLLAGKGHEDYQEIAGQRLPFSDIEQVKKAFARWAGLPNDGIASRRSVVIANEVKQSMTAGLPGLPRYARSDEAPVQGPRAVSGLIRADMMNLQQVADWLGQPLADGSDPVQVLIRRVHTDTRTLAPGDLFVALHGERFDGKDFLQEARAKGAVAAICQGDAAVEKLRQAGLPGLVVPDAKRALARLATRWRAQFSLPLIAVTGSNGKTTVTQMVASILRAHVPDACLATQGNLNNDIGVPLTVLGLRAHHRMAVVELGMNHPGEIAALAAIAQPTVALVNNAQREHLEFMETVEAVAQENGAVIDALPKDGVAVFPSDDAYSALWADKAGARERLCFGAPTVIANLPESGPARHTALEPDFVTASEARQSRQSESHGLLHCVRNDDPKDIGVFKSAVHTTRAVWSGAAWQVSAVTPQGALHYALHIAGAHNVKNSLAAAACALAAGVPLAAIAAGLEAFEPVKGRSRALLVRHGGWAITLVDDTYNANPDSVHAAIEVLAALPGPRLLVLGDMGEVGDQGPQFHAEALQWAQERQIEKIIVTGAACLQAAAPLAGIEAHAQMTDVQAAVLAALPTVASVLVKGSRFMKMERVVEAIVQAATQDKETAPC
jgi:murE/murF fusion protein